ncbi:hypothetical protein NXS19_003638 [Fusarium pseudograminearum]|nr:hypothetical protein NXS19_003638 [Fusarium pseudograminearum]
MPFKHFLSRFILVSINGLKSPKSPLKHEPSGVDGGPSVILAVQAPFNTTRCEWMLAADADAGNCSVAVNLKSGTGSTSSTTQQLPRFHPCLVGTYGSYQPS